MAPLLPHEHERLRQVASCLPNPNDREAAEKDIHLVELTLASDSRLLSDDRKARDIFAGLADRITQRSKILWATLEDDRCVGWLSEGARDEAYLRLGREREP